MILRILTPTALVVCLSVPVFADTMPGMDMTPTATDAPSTKDFKAGMAKMQAGMGQYTGDADRDFVVNMIPHHQGAVDMADTELEYGKDPELRTLAKNIVAAQEKEIALMQGWLAKHPQP